MYLRIETNPGRETMRKRKVWFGGMALFLAVALLGAFTQTGEDLFQKALRLERNEGKLMEAIGLYQKVVADGKDIGLAAQAQLRIGLCHEKLGQKNVQQAQEAFRKVVDNYPSRSQEVKVARERLSEIKKAHGIPAGLPEGLQISKIWTGPPGGDFMGAVSPDGKFLCFSDWETGDLAIRELESGENRRVTNKGSWQKSVSILRGPRTTARFSIAGTTGKENTSSIS
jgi:tetratricopeptide (TPR) repeat protein